jgi:thymidylate synthase
MAHLINNKTIFEAWNDAVLFLMDNGRNYHNIILTIENPEVLDPSWLTSFDPKKIKPGIKSIKDVANTIFPNKLKTKYKTREEIYERYKTLHQRKRKAGIWGTYFLRLISFGEKEINQLERVITKLNEWKKLDYKSAFVFHLSSPETDGPRKIGGPCWHFGELSIKGGKIDFSVVYRSHDYFGKALGNFIGLSWLLTFICEETGMEPGIITCHSVSAFLDSSKKQALDLVGGN